MSEHDSVTPLDLLNNKNYVEKSVRNERFDICKGCDYFFSLTGTCRSCGCFMGLKTWLKHASCPIDKWSEHP
jgi:hypothetical protein